MEKGMKIAVYTIAKNEEQFVQRWAESCKEADFRFILDTGSTDLTIEKAREFGVECEYDYVHPWRFDDARNIALSWIPEDIDICIALDMDEVLQPGWRQALESIADSVTRPRYKYVWSWNEDGSEGLVYGGDKIHRRHGYHWKHPVHEVLKSVGVGEIQDWVEGLEIHHHPDHTKSRSQYFDLLKLAVEEDPHDDRNQFYLAREYYFREEYGLAQFHFSEHLKLSQWRPERAASYRYLAAMRPDATEALLYRALSEDSNRRETWIDLAKHYMDVKNWKRCRMACREALAIKEKPLDYLCTAEAWGSAAYDMMALSYYYGGNSFMASYYGLKALEIEPNNERLKTNQKWYNKES